MTFTEFLLARIAEDEVDLRDATGADYCDDLSGVHYSNERVRAECDAKRRIIEIHEDRHGGCDRCTDGEGYGSDGFFWVGREQWPCETLRLLALPYATHPDYRQEWAI